jgi:hypothetical protein
MIFLPHDAAKREACIALVEEIVDEEKQDSVRAARITHSPNAAGRGQPPPIAIAVATAPVEIEPANSGINALLRPIES